MLKISWSEQIDWTDQVAKVCAYYKDKPSLKYGPANENGALELIATLCSLKCASRSYLNDTFQFSSDDAVGTILGNVTMAIQGSGDIDSPEDGGWYISVSNPPSYIVAPGFAEAWQQGT